MARGAATLVAILLVGLIGASTSTARTVAYQEGITNVDMGSDLVWSVKPAPANGQNNWWWYHQNNLGSGVFTAICYRFNVNGGAYFAPNGTTAYAAPTGGTGALPAAPATECEGTYANGIAGYLPAKSLAGLTNGMVVKYCAEEWFFSGGDWDDSADPERCQTIKADTAAPSIGVDLRQGGSPVSTTNSPGSVITNINYSDSASPPWNRGSVWGDNRLCTTTGLNCTSPPHTFNFSDSCSNGIKALNQTFTCAMGTPPGDGNFFQCFASFDGAVLDALPSNLADNTLNPTTLLNDDPAFNAQTFVDGTGNYAIGCDSVTVDTAAPNTSITAGPTEGSTISDTTPTFSFISTEGASTFQCQINSGAYSACPSPFTTGTLGGGAYTFRVKATDAAGNTDASPATRSFTISGPPDTTPPDTSITAGPAEGSTINDATPDFSFTSTEGGSTFQCRVDSAPFTACTTPHTTGTLGNGPHTFQVFSTDPSNNADASPASRSFTVSVSTPDTTPPDTSITAGPAEGSTINDATPDFSFTSTEGGSTFQCRVDSAPFTACTSPHTTGTLTSGPHTFQVYSTDPSNNADPSPASRAFTVSDTADTTPPDTSITGGPNEGATTGDNTPEFSFTSTESGGSFECKVDSGAFASCSSPHTTAALEDGAHTFLVRAKDATGNIDESPAGRAFTVSKGGNPPPGDKTPPDTKIKSKPKKSSTKRLAKFKFTSSEAGSTFTCKLDKAAYKACGSSFSKRVKVGRHKLSVKARDGAGNTDPSAATYSWKVRKPGR